MPLPAVSGVSDENGAFVLSGVGDGDWNLSAYAQNHGRAQNVEATAGAEGVRITLKRQ
jgi:hypothetical protein